MKLYDVIVRTRNTPAWNTDRPETVEARTKAEAIKIVRQQHDREAIFDRQDGKRTYTATEVK